jgi:hypothetical protein
MKTARPVERLLDRLDRVRQTGADRWIAVCPAHEDRSPSLSIREADDQTALVRCHAGCDTRDVMGALGLSLRDLFVGRVTDRTRLHDDRRLPARDALEIVRHEARVVQLVASDIRVGVVPDEEIMARIAAAMHRIDAAYLATSGSFVSRPRRVCAEILEVARA